MSADVYLICASGRMPASSSALCATPKRIREITPTLTTTDVIGRRGQDLFNDHCPHFGCERLVVISWPRMTSQIVVTHVDQFLMQQQTLGQGRRYADDWFRVVQPVSGHACVDVCICEEGDVSNTSNEFSACRRRVALKKATSRGNRSSAHVPCFVHSCACPDSSHFVHSVECISPIVASVDVILILYGSSKAFR